MNKQAWALAAAGWAAALYLAYCGNDQGPQTDAMAVTDAVADEWQAPPAGVHAGTLWVVDATGAPVGVAYSRRHPMLEESELYDAVSLYSPHTGLFFSVRMSNGEVLRPAKVFFSDSSCSGTAGIRTNCSSCADCEDCVSGFGTAFKSGSRWYRVKGGQPKTGFTYTTYLPEALGEPCTSHGSSDTFVFPAELLSEEEAPPAWTAPLAFRWVP